MAYGIGIALALLVSCFARVTGFDRDRAFYPTVVLIVASYYLLFAVMGGSSHALGVELVAMVAFVFMAVVGFRSSLWLVVAALAAHGIFDLFHGLIVANPGVPGWWPAFCSAFDVTAAGFLAWLVMRSSIKVRPNLSNMEVSETDVRERPAH
jgi:hypothetical protein